AFPLAGGRRRTDPRLCRLAGVPAAALLAGDAAVRHRSGLDPVGLAPAQPAQGAAHRRRAGRRLRLRLHPGLRRRPSLVGSMEELLRSLPIALSASALLFTLTGTALGILVGAIPGLSGTMLIALTLPLTFSMQPATALM